MGSNRVEKGGSRGCVAELPQGIGLGRMNGELKTSI